MKLDHIALLLFLMISSSLAAQTHAMEEFMYSSGKIYVVIGVVMIILMFIFFYLYRMDKRIKELEDE